MSRTNDTEPEDEYAQFSCTVKYLDTFINSVSSFVDEGKVVCTKDHVYTKVADPANVALCISRIKGEALNSLSVNGTDQMVTGLDFDKILDCLSGVSSTSDVEVTWPVTSGGTKLIRLDVIDEDLQFEVNTIDSNAVAKIPDIDPLSHNSRVKVDGSMLNKTISHADKMISEDDSGVLFETFNETLQISTTDITSGNFKKQFHNHDPSVDESLQEHSTSISISYLDDIRQILGKGDTVTVHVKEDNPIRLDVDLDESGDAQIIYIIAPRLDEQ